MEGNIKRSWLSPAPHKERLPNEQVRKLYPQLRWQIMQATFIGYAAFYLVRNHFGVASKTMQDYLHYTNTQLGLIITVTAIAYGVGKFFMGAVSDRSDARKFMSLGLLMTAICNFAFGLSHTYWLHVALWGANGLVQCMGWAPCGRSMGHWFGKNERGLMFSVWNTSINIGGGIAGLIAGWGASMTGYGLAGWISRTAENSGPLASTAAWLVARLQPWQYAFIVPAIIAFLVAIFLFLRMKDTPQSCGLPPIEEYKGEVKKADEKHEREFSAKELFFDYVLKNKYIWMLAIANFFVYIARYSMVDWGPKYLQEVKGASVMGGGLGVFVVEFSAIVSTIVLGWASDKLGGRRGIVNTLCMIPVLGAFIVILVTPTGNMFLMMTMLSVIGIFVYPVVNLVTMQALDVTSKKAIGTAAGFIGMFGYLGKAIQGVMFGWILDHNDWVLKHFKWITGDAGAWNLVIAGIVLCTLIGILLFIMTWNIRPRDHAAEMKEEGAAG